MSGRVVVLTGATSGIGRATAEALSRRGARLILANRSEERTLPVIAELKTATGNNAIAFVRLDLGDLASVRTCASALLSRDEPIHVLINNAGLAGQRGLTASGFELAFGTNHVGHFLLTTLLLDRLKASAPARVVTVSSIAHNQPRGIDWNAVRESTRSFTGMPEYGVSKFANVLFSQELARRTEGTGVTTYALHPGAIASDIWRRVPWPIRPLMTMMMKSNEDGAKTSVYCATSEDLAKATGRYYDNSHERPASGRATPELGAELWRRSEEWTG